MTGVNIAIIAFAVMTTVAVFAGIIAAISAVVGFSKPEDCDE